VHGLQFQVEVVFLPVCNLDLGDARCHGSLSDSLREALNETGVKRSGHDVVRTESELLTVVGSGDDIRNWLFSKGSQCKGAVHLHPLVDFWRSSVECTSEKEGEAHDIVDLIWIVRTTSGDDSVRTHRLGECRGNLGLWVGHSKDDWLLSHLSEEFWFQGTSGRHANEDISTVKRVFKGSCIGLNGKILLLGIHTCGSTFIDDSFRITDLDVLLLDSISRHESDASDTSRTSTEKHDLRGSNISSSDLHRIDETSQADDSSPVLIVVEDWNIHKRLELLLNIEAVWSFDIFKVDSSKGRSEQFDTVDEFFRVLSVDADVDRFNTSEFVEKDSLALHHWLGSKRADVTETKDSGAVGDDSDSVALVCVLVGCFLVLCNGDARYSNTWGVGERKILLVVHWLGGLDSELPWDRRRMVEKWLFILISASLDDSGLPLNRIGTR